MPRTQVLMSLIYSHDCTSFFALQLYSSIWSNTISYSIPIKYILKLPSAMIKTTHSDRKCALKFLLKTPVRIASMIGGLKIERSLQMEGS